MPHRPLPDGGSGACVDLCKESRQGTEFSQIRGNSGTETALGMIRSANGSLDIVRPSSSWVKAIRKDSRPFWPD
jgi:hypothetical protein